MTIILDTSGTGSSTGADSSTTTTIVVNAFGPNEIILVGCEIGSTSTTTLPILSISGAGLTWTQIGTIGGPGISGFYHALTAWVAVTTGSITGSTLTITSSQNIDAASSVYATYIGCIVAKELDPNINLPSLRFENGTMLMPEAAFSTTKAPDLLFCFTGSNDVLGWTNPVSPVGSNIVSTSSSTYSREANIGLMTVPVATTQSSTVYGNAYATNRYWNFVGHSLMQAAITISKLVGYSALSPSIPITKITNYSALSPRIPVSKVTGYSTMSPKIPVSKIVGYAVLDEFFLSLSKSVSYAVLTPNPPQVQIFIVT